MSHTGYLVIADITVYTAYLSQSELEHARDSLNSLPGSSNGIHPTAVTHLSLWMVMPSVKQPGRWRVIPERVQKSFIAFRQLVENEISAGLSDSEAGSKMSKEAVDPANIEKQFDDSA